MRTDTATFTQRNVALSKEPRYVVEVAFDLANTVLWYFTSHADAALPGGGSVITSVLERLSGTSQQVNPDQANATIGNIDFDFVDKGGIVTSTLGAQLALGRSTRQQRVRVYMGYAGDAWADYTLIQTQLVSQIDYSAGMYTIHCQDIQRSMRNNIFTQASTPLAAVVLIGDTTIQVVDTSAFSMVAHGTSYSDAPSATVGYIKIENEVIRYTGKTSTTFTGCVRGALNTVAAAHVVDLSPTSTVDSRLRATEYVYLELPAIDLMYRLLTGKDRTGASALPTTWNLGISTTYVRLSDFTGIGKDLWDLTDDLQGFPVRFEDLQQLDGKKFIETELALLLGVFMPVYADGSLGCKRLANILSGAAYAAQLDESNTVSVSPLTHDFAALHNVIQVSWNWEPSLQAFTRINVFLDQPSITVHQPGTTLKLAFRGLHGSRHSAVMLQSRFDALRDRYTGPPMRLTSNVMHRFNSIEVGDVVRCKYSTVRDFVANAPLDRSFEVQGISIDWVTGALGLKLFASSRAPSPLPATGDATVLTGAWYTSQGTLLATGVGGITITGSNPGHITVGGTLAGNADLTNTAAIYYYVGDLQLDANVNLNINQNVQLRVQGNFQISGTINGKGAGLTGGAQSPVPPPFSGISGVSLRNAGSIGFLGSTEAGGGLFYPPGPAGVGFISDVRGGQVIGLNAVVPSFNVTWDGTLLRGLPVDLRGTSGSSGNNTVGAFPGGGVALGGAGGAGGAGLCVICRGYSVGASGRVNLSGGDGTAGGVLTNLADGTRWHAGSGAGGAPGGLLVLLDGAGVTATGLTDAGFVAVYGNTPITGPLFAPIAVLASGDYTSAFVGTGDGTTFPLPSLSGARGGSRVQFVPASVLPALDHITPPEILFDEMIAANWTLRANSNNLNLTSIAWSPTLGLFAAVGTSTGGVGTYIVTSPDGIIWTRRTDPNVATPNNGLAIAWGNGIFVFYAGSKMLTSSDGITWTSHTLTQAQSYRAIAYGAGLFVAVGTGTLGVDSIITSPDGITWTTRTNPITSAAMTLNGVFWNGSMFVAVGSALGTQGTIITSPDGLTWTQRSNPRNFALNGVTWFRNSLTPSGLWVAVGDKEVSANSYAYLLTSPDAITWTEQVNPVNTVLLAVGTSGLILVAVGGVDASNTAYIITSRDGINWVKRDDPINLALNSIAWSGRRFAVVGTRNGVQATILTSLSR